MSRFASLFLFLTILSQNALASLLAIDYGSDWIKASVMSPGVPFDVLLDKSSKRKIQSTVGWKREDRLFGSDAFNIAGRYPSDSFSSLKYLQGVPFDSQPVSFYKSISVADLAKTPRGTVALKRSDGTEWSTEELIAMQFQYVRELAEAAAKEKITDVIVTVPPYFTAQERRAVDDAVQLAGMQVSGLIHDGTAVAVNYAMTRTFAEQPEYHVIYDAGASSIRATVAAFTTSGDAKKRDQFTSIAVKGVGFDRNTGGTELDRRLREILVNDFNKKHKKDIRQDKRGMAKLWKEAGRVKTILSANAEAMSSVESVAFDIDYRSKISRNEFENASKDLKIRYAKPIFEALSNAGLSLDNVTSVILTGGASRTPMIQAAVKAAVGESKIALNVNADEAAVLGAALYGASLSPQFKTKDIRVADIVPYDVQVTYNAEAKSDTSKPRAINTVVFPVGTKYGTKKTVTFKRKDDFSLKLAYRSPPVSGYPSDIVEVDIQGVQEALQNLTEAGATDPVVKATVTVTESGFPQFVNVFAFGEIPDDSITGKLKGLFGGSSSTSAQETETEEPATKTDSGAAEPTPAPSDVKKEKPKDTIQLKIETRYSSVPPMSVEEKRAATQRLKAIQYAEAAVREKEEARNSLEAYLYRVRDLLEDESETPFRKCSREEDRQAMRQTLEETFTWLHEHGDDAQTNDYRKRRDALQKHEQPVIHRYTEIQEFPKALNISQMWNWKTRMFITEAKMNLSVESQGGEPARYTKEELDALEKTLKEHETWLNEVAEKRKATEMYDDPPVEASELRAKVKVLENHYMRLAKKKVPKKKPATSTTSSSTTSTASPTEQTKGHDEL